MNVATPYVVTLCKLGSECSDHLDHEKTLNFGGGARQTSIQEQQQQQPTEQFIRVYDLHIDL